MYAASYVKKTLVVVALAGAMLAGSFGPASAFLDKTRFVAHLGVAYFAFHHWVWNPYKQGAFTEGAPHRTAAIVKGGIALLFAVHEVKVAKKIADKSSDPLLQKLDQSLGTLTDNFGTIGQKLKSGSFNAKDLEALGGVAALVTSQASAHGINIKDIPIKIPGT